jgi:tetratricopeptide (TPR) repeat protein
MKKEMDFALSGEIKIDSLADIAEVALQQDQFTLAIKYAEQGLELILPMHAQNVRFYCILMRAHNGLDNFDECEKFFQLATEILYHHLGQSHPLHVTVYSLMSYLLIPKGKFEEALYLYKSALLCS